MRIKKAQAGKNLPKKSSKKEEMVPSEMFPGKMIPKSKSNYATGKIAKMLESGKSKSAPVKKTVAPKKKMKDGGKAFPDLNKDGKVTKADILVGRGVIKAKKGIKAQGGTKVALRSGQLKRLGKLSAKNPAKAEQVGSKMVERATRQSRGKEYLKKNLSELMPKSKYGSKTGKCRYGCK